MIKYQLYIVVACLVGCGFERTVPWYEKSMKADYEQIDRIGLPHLDEVFYGEAALNAIRVGDPGTDDKKLKPLLIDGIEALRGVVSIIPEFKAELETANSPDELAELWTPNVISIDLTSAVSFEEGNGRPIDSEDSFDLVISAALGRFLEDQVGIIPRGVSEKFPYLAPPRRIEDKEDLSEGGVTDDSATE